MDVNPYATPESEVSSPEAGSPAVRQPHLSESRFSILFIACVCGTNAAIALIGFIVNLFLKYPGTDTRVLIYDPLFVAGQAIRAVALGMLTWRLLQYRATIRILDASESAGAADYTIAHQRL